MATIKNTVYTKNTKGNDYICGDIHGSYDELMAKLEELDFCDDDRIFFVGDLVDRGKDSLKCIRLLHRKNFISVMGNHELFCLESACRKNTEIHKANGGKWFFDLTEVERDEVISLIRDLPIAITIDNGWNRYGIVHAQPLKDWNHIDGDYSEYITNNLKDIMQWSRDYFHNWKNEERIKNVDYVFCGHTPFNIPKDKESPIYANNVIFIDNGFWYYKDRKPIILNIKDFK